MNDYCFCHLESIKLSSGTISWFPCRDPLCFTLHFPSYSVCFVGHWLTSSLRDSVEVYTQPFKVSLSPGQSSVISMSLTKSQWSKTKLMWAATEKVCVLFSLDLNLETCGLELLVIILTPEIEANFKGSRTSRRVWALLSLFEPLDQDIPKANISLKFKLIMWFEYLFFLK